MNRIIDFLAVTVAAALARLPRAAALRLGGWFGAVVSLVGRHKNPRIHYNLGRAGLTDTKGACSRSWRNLGVTMFEMVWTLGQEPEQVLQRIEIEGLDELRRAGNKGKGVLLVSGHSGNWELVPPAAARHSGRPVAVIARSLRTPGLERRIIAFRERAGVRTLVRGAAGASVAAFRTLSRGGILGCMMDRASGGRRITLPFMGNLTRAPLGPAELACRAGAAVVLGISERADDFSLRIRFEEIAVDGIDQPEELTRVMIEALDTALRRRPEHWFWIYRKQPYLHIPTPEEAGATTPTDG